MHILGEEGIWEGAMVMNYQASFAIHLHRQGKSPATIRHYTHAVAGFADYCGRTGRRGSLRKNLQLPQLEGYRDDLLNARELRPSTINGRLTALSALARFLLEQGLLACNPLELVARVNKAGICKPHPRASWEKVQELRHEVNLDVMDLTGRIIVELLYTGLTVRELHSLQWNGEPARDSLRAGKRTIMLHPEAQLALKHYMILRPILMGDFLIVGQGEEWSLKPGAVYSLLKRLSRKIKAQISVRDLRLAQFTKIAGGLSTASGSREKMAA
ncbi:MAG: phage integrase N-terminal SAM-like domain-containing protein [Syntrophomonadaceae bacterium]|nr:phage integrase N-terminal SAM-like domain-containing protein [Syntrophomonadaceae bacterium]